MIWRLALTRVPQQIRLRSRQVAYLQRLAGDGHSLSAVLAAVIEATREAYGGTPAATLPSRKARVHFVMTADHLEFVDRIASNTGLPRGDVVRRLIDDAEARGFRL